MNKSFKIARKPGQSVTPAVVEPKVRKTKEKKAAKSAPAQTKTLALGNGPTTRKTIEVPEDYFYRVKMRALERKILEKELWAEILQEYFETHQTA